MSNKPGLYYVVTDFDGTINEAYVYNTQFGVLELGCVERNNIYEERYLTQNVTLNSYLQDLTGELVYYTKVD